MSRLRRPPPPGGGRNRSGGAPDVLAVLRRGAKLKAPNARSLAASADNPGCNARRVLDAAGIDKSDLASRLGRPMPEGQSIFALQRGNRFEADVKAYGYAALLDLLRREGLPVDAVRVLPLKDLYPIDPHRPERALIHRTRETRNAVLAMARGARGAYNLVDGGALEWDYGGVIARLETDGIAWRLGDRIHVVEIKSFPIVDGQTDRDKLGAAARQSAVYVAAIKDELDAAGLDPELVSTEVLLVCPRNTSLTPTMVHVDVARQVKTLRRLLTGRASVPNIVGALGPNITLDTSGMAEASAVAHIAGVLDTLGTNYLPSCLSSCSLAFHCRAHARAVGDPGYLGSDARTSLGPVRTLPRAVELSRGAPPDPTEAESAAQLVRARRLLAAAGVAPVVPLSGKRQSAK